MSDTSAKVVSALENVVAGLLSGAMEEDAEALGAMVHLPAFQAGAAAVKARDPEAFHFGLDYPISRLVGALLEQELPGHHKAKFLFEHSQFVERHFLKLIERFEGSACSVDKSRFLLRSLAKHLIDGSPIVFDRAARYTYHLPVRVFLTEQEVTAFFEGLHHLYYGRPESYLAALNDLVNRVAQAPA